MSRLYIAPYSGYAIWERKGYLVSPSRFQSDSLRDERGGAEPDPRGIGITITTFKSEVSRKVLPLRFSLLVRHQVNQVLGSDPNFGLRHRERLKDTITPRCRQAQIGPSYPVMVYTTRTTGTARQAAIYTHNFVMRAQNAQKYPSCQDLAFP